jgi:hypothetical protein
MGLFVLRMGLSQCDCLVTVESIFLVFGDENGEAKSGAQIL